MREAWVARFLDPKKGGGVDLAVGNKRGRSSKCTAYKRRLNECGGNTSDSRPGRVRQRETRLDRPCRSEKKEIRLQIEVILQSNRGARSNRAARNHLNKKNKPGRVKKRISREPPFGGGGVF